MTTLLEKLNRRRAGLRGSRGFSLVELAVVIVVIGILVAIAVPVFNGIQDGAKNAVLKAAAANGASMVAAEVAIGHTEKLALDEGMTRLAKNPVTAVTLIEPASGAVSLTNFCVQATDGEASEVAGPGCDGSEGEPPAGETTPPDEVTPEPPAVPQYVVTLDTRLSGCTNPGVNVIAPAGASVTAEWQGQSKTVTTSATTTPAVTPGEFQVTFTGTGATFAAGLPVMASCLKSVDRWDAGFTQTGQNAFFNASNLTSVVTPPAGLTSMTSMFRNATSFNQPIDHWDVSGVKRMNMMFDSAAAFNQPLNSWDVGEVTTMNRMFYRAAAFNQDLDRWDTGLVTDMAEMFQEAFAFNGALNGWDVKNVTTMSSMFYRASAFNQPLDGWEPLNVTNMAFMFNGATLFGQDLSGWPVEKVSNWTYFEMHSGLTSEMMPKFGANLGGGVGGGGVRP